MSKILDPSNSLEALTEKEKVEHEPDGQQVAHKGQLRFVTAKRVKHEPQLFSEELAIQARQHEAAIAEAHKHANEETRRAEEHVAQMAQEARMEALARERAQAEQAAQDALAARIGAEHQLTAQLAARIEQEKFEREQIALRVAHEEQLKSATAERETQERLLQADEQEALARQHEAAIAEARKRATEETQRAEEHAAQMAQEARLEALSRERAQAEQAAQEALAVRIGAEHQLAAQLAARIEQEKLEREQTANRAAHEEQLRLATAERETQERLLRTEKQETLARQHVAPKTAGAAPPRSMKDRATERVIINRPPPPGQSRSYLGWIAIILLIIGAGYFMNTSSWFFDSESVTTPVKSAGSKAQVSVTATTNLPVPEIQAATDQSAIAAKPQQLVETEIRQMAMQWAEAWSRRDAATYLSFYAADFSLPEGMQRGDWEAQRQSRLRKYRSIEVTLKNVEISYSGGDEASVRFAQDFQADSYKEMGTHKELRLKNVQGRWLIVSEKNV